MAELKMHMFLLSGLMMSGIEDVLGERISPVKFLSNLITSPLHWVLDVDCEKITTSKIGPNVGYVISEKLESRTLLERIKEFSEQETKDDLALKILRKHIKREISESPDVPLYGSRWESSLCRYYFGMEFELDLASLEKVLPVLCETLAQSTLSGSWFPQFLVGTKLEHALSDYYRYYVWNSLRNVPNAIIIGSTLLFDIVTRSADEAKQILKMIDAIFEELRSKYWIRSEIRWSERHSIGFACVTRQSDKQSLAGVRLVVRHENERCVKEQGSVIHALLWYHRTLTASRQIEELRSVFMRIGDEVVEGISRMLGRPILNIYKICKGLKVLSEVSDELRRSRQLVKLNLPVIATTLGTDDIIKILSKALDQLIKSGLINSLVNLWQEYSEYYLGRRALSDILWCAESEVFEAIDGHAQVFPDVLGLSSDVIKKELAMAIKDLVERLDVYYRELNSFIEANVMSLLKDRESSLQLALGISSLVIGIAISIVLDIVSLIV